MNDAVVDIKQKYELMNVTNQYWLLLYQRAYNGGGLIFNGLWCYPTTKIRFRSICLIFDRFLFRITLAIIELFADWRWGHEVLQILVYL
jgi:hypothetical protein